MNGYVKLYRKILDNPILSKDADRIAVWMYLLLNATHKEMDALFGSERITLKPGQLITGRKAIAKQFNVNESKVNRILKIFKNEHQIEQQTCNKGQLITILNWSYYQGSEQQSEQQVNNKRTASEQQVNTNKNDKNVKNDKNDKNKTSDVIVERKIIPPTLEMVQKYCDDRKNGIDAEMFIAFYQSKEWFIGKNKMKDWHAAIHTWEKYRKIDKEKNKKTDVATPDYMFEKVKKNKNQDEEKRIELLKKLKG